MRRASAGLVAAIFIAGMAISACSSRDSSQRPGGDVHYATGGTFSATISTDPGTFDPYHSTLIFGQAYLAYDSLVNMRRDGTFVSGLAQKWEADPRSATFTLRPGITCSDGTPLTATQVAAAITFVADPKNQSPQLGVTVPTVPLAVGADDSTRRVTVKAAKPFGLLLNTVGQLPIMCEKGLKNPNILKTTSDGTGPFVLTNVVAGQSYAFTVRKGYSWGPGGASTSAPGTPAKVVLRVVPNETTAANLLLSGAVNLATVTGEDRRRLDAQGLRKIEDWRSGVWLWFNERDAGRPTADPRVRQALVQALNLDQITKVSTEGTGKAASGLVAMRPRACPSGDVSALLPGLDTSKAAALLDAAGWREGADGTRRMGGKTLALHLHYVGEASSLNKPTAELLVKAWEAIGVRVDLTQETFSGWTRTMFQTGDFDIQLQGLNLDFPDQAVAYLSGPVPPQGTNVAGIKNTDYSRLASEAEAKTVPDACPLWNQAEQALYRNFNPVPLVDRPLLSYLRNAQADAIGLNIPVPTSLRVLK